MTRRQRMAYQAANATESAAENIEFENEFIELETKRKDHDKSNKPKITQSQADEIRRKELDKILEEQLQKIRDKEKKMKAKEGAVNATGQAQGYIYQGNSLKMNNQGGGQLKPGMEQFTTSIRTKITAKGTTVGIPHGLKLPEILRQKKAQELHKAIG